MQRAIAAVALCLLLAGCASADSAPQSAPTLTLAGETFAVEIADTPSARSTGLMHRTELCDTCGMLFTFDAPSKVSFWMKNTFIPLDILYFDAEHTLTEIYANTPPCDTDPCPHYPSSSDTIQYVLELPAGTTEKIQATIGTAFTLHE